MLIPSHRHRQADMRLWRELEDADHVRARTLAGRLESLASRSIAVMEEFVGAGPCYAATSWGKDSMVLCHLIAASGLDVPVYHFVVRGLDTPETDATRDAFLAAWPIDYREIECDAEKSGDGWDLKGAKVKASRRLPGDVRDRWIHGMRFQESSVRRIFFRRFGLASGASCGPLGWWRTSDVFAHLAINGLPVHPSYAMLGGGRWDRRHLRVSPVGGTMGEQFGRREWETEYYGDVLRRMESMACQ